MAWHMCLSTDQFSINHRKTYIFATAVNIGGSVDNVPIPAEQPDVPVTVCYVAVDTLWLYAWRYIRNTFAA